MAPLPKTTITLVHRSISTLVSDHVRLKARKIQDLHTNALFGVGSKNPDKLPNGFILGIIAAIGAALVLTAVWFFFRAKNGGFQFREGDWEDYKSTVLRRKGPDGRTLSNATKSTKLGGGSVVHGQSAWGSEKHSSNKTSKKDKKTTKGSKGKSVDEKTTVTDSTGYTDLTGSSYYDDPSDAGNTRGGGGSGYLAGRPAHGNTRDPELEHYRHEKAAKVGGLNRQHDGTHYDYSGTGSDLSSRPLVNKKGAVGDKERKKYEKAEKAADEKRRKEDAKREKANAKAAAAAKKAAKSGAKSSKPASQSATQTKDYVSVPAQPSKPASQPATQTKDFASVPAPSTKRSQPSAAYSFTPGDEESNYTSPSQEGSYYYNAYRPAATESPQSASNTPQSRNRDRRSESRTRPASSQPSIGSPSKPSRARPASEIPPSVPGSWGQASDVGTKVYSHHIPGLSRGTTEIGVDESVSQVGARRAAAKSGGYRRSGLGGGVGIRRRDR